MTYCELKLYKVWPPIDPSTYTQTQCKQESHKVHCYRVASKLNRGFSEKNGGKIGEKTTLFCFCGFFQRCKLLVALGVISQVRLSPTDCAETELTWQLFGSSARNFTNYSPRFAQSKNSLLLFRKTISTSSQVEVRTQELSEKRINALKKQVLGCQSLYCVLLIVLAKSFYEWFDLFAE